MSAHSPPAACRSPSHARALPALVATILLAGCAQSVYRTYDVPVSTHSDGTLDGIGYYLPKGQVRFSGKLVGTDFQITLQPEIVPDLEAGEFYLSPTANILYDDSLTIRKTPSGLLTSVESTTEDRTGEIGGAAADALGSALKFAIGLPPGVAKSESDTPVNWKPFLFTFDPRNAEGVTAVNQSLGAYQVPVRIESIPDARLTMLPDDGDVQSMALPTATARVADYPGLLARPPVGVRLKVYSEKGSPYPVSFEGVVMLPDSDRIMVLGSGRTPFIKKVNNVTFTHGMVTERHLSIPSQAMGVVAVPKTILKSLAPLPLQLKTEVKNHINIDRELSGAAD